MGVLVTRLSLSPNFLPSASIIMPADGTATSGLLVMRAKS